MLNKFPPMFQTAQLTDVKVCSSCEESELVNGIVCPYCQDKNMFYGPDGRCTKSNPTRFYETIARGTKVSKESCAIALLEDGTSTKCVKECPEGTKLVNG